MLWILILGISNFLVWILCILEWIFRWITCLSSTNEFISITFSGKANFTPHDQKLFIIRHAFKERIFLLILTNVLNMQYQILFAHFIAFSFFLCFFPWRCWSSPPWSVVTTWHTSHLEIVVIYIRIKNSCQLPTLILWCRINSYY